MKYISNKNHKNIIGFLNCKRGFTLIEIIAVIIIMGILLLIVFPATSRLMRSNDEKKYVSYYEIVEAGLEKYGRTRRSELGGSTGIGCFDDQTVTDLIEGGYIKLFDQEEDVECETLSHYSSTQLAAWGIDTSKNYASMRVEGDNGQITIKLSMICVKKHADGTYSRTLEYENLVEAGPECAPNVSDGIPVYAINYDYDGGNAPSTGVPSSYKYGVGATIDGVPTKNESEFNGWKDSVGDVSFVKVISPESTGNKKFKAQWCQKCSPVEHGSCELNYSVAGTCTYITSCEDGYEISNEGTSHPVCTYIPPAVYSIKYKYEGGNAPSTGVPGSYTFGIGATINGRPTKDGYEFNGWSDSAGTSFVKTIGPNDSGDKTYTAKWCQKCSHVEHGSCELNYSVAGTCTYITSCEDGYAISGAGTSHPVCTYIPPAVYSIKYKYDGGNAPSTGVPSSYTFGVGATINGIPTKGGYEFNGWSDSAGTSFVKTIGKNDSGDKTYTAKWCKKCANVVNGTCRLNNEGDGTCKYVTSCDANYHYSSGENTADPICSPDMHTLSYNMNGSSSTCTSITKNHGEAWGSLCEPSLSGYAFKGWYYGSQKITSASIATSDITVTASWEVANVNPSLTLYKYRGIVDNDGWCGIAKEITQVNSVCQTCTGTCPCVVHILAINPPLGYSLNSVTVTFNPTPSNHSSQTNTWTRGRYLPPAFQGYTVFRYNSSDNEDRGVGTNGNFFMSGESILLRFRNENGTNGISGSVIVSYTNGATGFATFYYDVTSVSCKSFGVN